MCVMSRLYPERSTAKRPSQLSEGSKVALLSHCSPASSTSSTRVIRLREVNSPRRRTLTLGRSTQGKNSHLGEGLTLKRKAPTYEKDSGSGEGFSPKRRTRECAARAPRVAASANFKCMSSAVIMSRRFRIYVERLDPALHSPDLTLSMPVRKRECRDPLSPLLKLYRVP